MALALLAFGEAATEAFKVRLRLEAGPDWAVAVAEGATRDLPVKLRPEWVGVRLDSPGPIRRELQVDGTDTAATQDRDPAHVQALLDTPVYPVLAWLRDEGGYSRWEAPRLLDRQGGVLGVGQDGVEAATLPPEGFVLEVELRRPEAEATIWLVDADGVRLEGLGVSRERRAWRWLARGGVGTMPEERVRWFFPEDAGPHAAGVAQLLGRSVVAGWALALLVGLLGWCLRGVPAPRARRVPRLAVLALAGGLLVAWVAAASWVTVALYRQMPHVLDAVSYWFQAGVLASGRLWLDPPPLADAFKGPFQVLWDGRWYSQYPPGAPVAYGAGRVLGLGWLVGPLGGAALIGGTAWAARELFGRATAAWALGLGLASPFVLFQAGSFLSHPVAGGLLAVGLAATLRGERLGRQRWYALAGVALGAAFTVREAATVLFGLPVLAWLAFGGRLRGMLTVLAAGAPFLVLYGLYNWQVTGHPLLLPRMMFVAGDTFGFGDGFGFFGRHTPAAGLANLEAQLSLLQFDLFGWPPLFALGLMGLPLLVGRPTRGDLLLVGAAALFAGTYVAYFYHGIVLGPRYMYEMLPWLLLLAARGVQRLGEVARRAGAQPGVAGLVAALPVVALTLYAALYYLPRQVERRTHYVAYPFGLRYELPFVATTIQGPTVTGVEAPALVLTRDWWTYSTMLAGLNCAALDAGRIDACPVLFAVAATEDDAAKLKGHYAGSGRRVYWARHGGGVLRVEPEPVDQH